MSVKKAILIVVILIAIAGGSYAYWRMEEKGEGAAYLTVVVGKANIRQVVSSTGTVQAVVTVQVGSQVSGTIAKLSADFNSKVTKGEVVALLDQSKFKARVEEERANLLAAQASLAKSKVTVSDNGRTLARNRELMRRNLISQSELDAAQAAYDAAVSQVRISEAQVAQARAALNQASVDLGYTVIRSPVDGIVISRNVDVGQTVAASLSAPTLFTIANDLSKMEVQTAVDEADVGRVWEGQDVTFTVDAHPGRRFFGKVYQVRNAATVVQNVVTYNAVVRIENQELLLKPGMTANVQFLVSEKEDVVAIPNMALRFKPPEARNRVQEALRAEERQRGPRAGGRSTRRSGGGGGEARRGRRAEIYVLRGTKAEPVEVRLGISDGSKTEITGGDLKENEAVIIGVDITGGKKVTAGLSNPLQFFRRFSFGR